MPRRSRLKPPRRTAPAATAKVPQAAADPPVARSVGVKAEKPRERDVFEVASMVFGGLIAFFGAWGAIATAGGGVGSAGFVISVIFVALGLGRLYYGFHGH